MIIVQYIIVTAVLCAAIGYALWRAYQAVRHANDPCYGCSGCALKEIKKGKDCTFSR